MVLCGLLCTIYNMGALWQILVPIMVDKTNKQTRMAPGKGGWDCPYKESGRPNQQFQFLCIYITHKNTIYFYTFYDYISLNGL